MDVGTLCLMPSSGCATNVQIPTWKSPKSFSRDSGGENSPLVSFGLKASFVALILS